MLEQLSMFDFYEEKEPIKEVKVSAKPRNEQKTETEVINELIGIKESFELPDKLMKIMLDKNQRENLFNNFLKYKSDLTYDAFRDYFQKEHGDRESLKQDYTPDCICKLISELQPNANKIIDVCSGTGALTISTYNKQKDIFFQCVEVSSRAIPVLLFNLSIRGINSIVKQEDVLTKEIKHTYKLTKNGEFSDIEEISEAGENKFDLAISNPPYSLSWEPKNDVRFSDYELAPKSKADYAFVLDVLYRLNETGKAFIVLPHGVLFRGDREGNIRQKLIENNLIDTIIGLPDKLFLNTQIPVCIMILKKHRGNKDILFINASKLFIAKSKQNDMSDEQIVKIVSAYKNRTSIDKFCRCVSYEELQNNDYNLNIPRYVDTSEPEPVPDLKECVQEIIRIDKEIKQVNSELKTMFEQLEGTTKEENEYYQENIKPLIDWLG